MLVVYPVDPTGLFFAVGFIVLGLSVIPLDRALDRRRRRRARFQAHRR